MPGEVTGKIEFRIRQDHAAHSRYGVGLTLFRRVWLAGFKACLDMLIVELRGAEEHGAADLLVNVRKSWPS